MTKIPVKETGTLEEGGWAHLNDKPLENTNLYILLIWDEPMDETGGGVYCGQHLIATGEFPSASEMLLCRGTFILCASGWKECREDTDINFSFSNHSEMLEAYDKALTMFLQFNTWRCWIRAYYTRSRCRNNFSTILRIIRGYQP